MVTTAAFYKFIRVRQKEFLFFRDYVFVVIVYFFNMLDVQIPSSFNKTMIYCLIITSKMLFFVTGHEDKQCLTFCSNASNCQFLK